ncbi:MAG: plastocyanin/azurin family copper-binding protein [Candidatus Limnocylindrales bacterium]
MSTRLGLAGAGLLIAGVVMIGAGSLSGGAAGGTSMMGAGGFSMMGGTSGGMMAGIPTGMMGGSSSQTTPGPGEAGFVAGTAASPRVVRVIAGPGYTFSPSTIAVAKGETVTFEVTSMGGLTHEFMVGPADAVAADQAGTPEAAGIGMMQTASVTYTFDGSGPYAFACHAPGHYEAGMRGTITVVG